MNLDNNEAVLLLLEGCKAGDRESQKKLYQTFYGYSMSVCLRYASSRQEAQEILNDGFMKVFTKLDTFDEKKTFKLWLRRILIHTAIDLYRKNQHFRNNSDISEAYYLSEDPQAIGQITEQEILSLVQKLSPAYRTVFNLHVIEGYTHEEIGRQLGIHEGTSKSNLFKARQHLQKMLTELYEV